VGGGLGGGVGGHSFWCGRGWEWPAPISFELHQFRIASLFARAVGSDSVIRKCSLNFLFRFLPYSRFHSSCIKFALYRCLPMLLERFSDRQCCLLLCRFLPLSPCSCGALSCLYQTTHPPFPFWASQLKKHATGPRPQSQVSHSQDIMFCANSDVKESALVFHPQQKKNHTGVECILCRKTMRTNSSKVLQSPGQYWNR
jgi:hypothetical protein